MSEANTFFNAVGWVATYSGVAFNVIEPRREDVQIEDIAHALSHQCRYGGHFKRFYSVAEHCIHVAKLAPDHLKLEALLHDGSEAYLLDIPRPIKKALPEYRDIEDRLMTVIGERYGIDWPVDPDVTSLDNRILIDEVEQGMTAVPGIPWGVPGERLGVELRFWGPAAAESRFLSAFHRYRRASVRKPAQLTA